MVGDEIFLDEFVRRHHCLSSTRAAGNSRSTHHRVESSDSESENPDSESEVSAGFESESFQ